MEEVIISNRAKCLCCGDVIFSKHVHDFVTCYCGALSVDGGQHYLKRLFVLKEEYEELSVVISMDQLEILEDKLHDANERNCNDFGIICGILVGCRDAGLLED